MQRISLRPPFESPCLHVNRRRPGRGKVTVEASEPTTKGSRPRLISHSIVNIQSHGHSKDMLAEGDTSSSTLKNQQWKRRMSDVQSLQRFPFTTLCRLRCVVRLCPLMRSAALSPCHACPARPASLSLYWSTFATGCRKFSMRPHSA